MSNNLRFLTKGRRRFRRLHTIGNITISRGDGSRAYEGKMLNICEDGMKCATDLPLNTLSPVDIKVEQSADTPRNERHSGKVVWGTFTGDLNHGNYLYGIKFIFPSSMSSP